MHNNDYVDADFGLYDMSVDNSTKFDANVIKSNGARKNIMHVSWRKE